MTATCSCRTPIAWVRLPAEGIIAVDHESIGARSGDIAVAWSTAPGNKTGDLHGRILQPGDTLARGEQYAQTHRHHATTTRGKRR